MPPSRSRAVSRQETLPRNTSEEVSKFQKAFRFIIKGLKSDKQKARNAAEKIYVNFRQMFYRLFMEQCTRMRHPNNKLNISTDDFLQMTRSGHTNSAFEETLERR